MAKAKQTGMMKWDEELARQAQVAAGMEASTAVGSFFSLKAGQLSWAGSPLPGNQMAVVILDSILENVFYGGEYDEANPQGPMCFAFGREDKAMAPHKVCVEAGSSQGSEDDGKCQGCPMNEWGTADKGRGKACKNTRRLSMIPAGTLDAQGKLTLADAAAIESAGIGYLRLPVTSVKGYAAFVTQTSGALRRPPHGVVTKVSLVPDVKNQFKVVFTPMMSVPDELMGAVMARHDEATKMIEFPYQPFEAKEEQPKKSAPAKAKPVPRGVPAKAAAPAPSGRPVPRQQGSKRY